MRPRPVSILFPYTTLFRSKSQKTNISSAHDAVKQQIMTHEQSKLGIMVSQSCTAEPVTINGSKITQSRDRKSTRLNSSHVAISYAVFCLKKKKKARHDNKA